MACTTGLTGEQERRLVEASARIGVLKSQHVPGRQPDAAALGGGRAFLGDAYRLTRFWKSITTKKVDVPPAAPPWPWPTPSTTP